MNAITKPRNDESTKGSAKCRLPCSSVQSVDRSLRAHPIVVWKASFKSLLPSCFRRFVLS